MNAKADSCGNKLTRMLLDGKGQNLAAGFSRSEAALAFSSVSINDHLLEGMRRPSCLVLQYFAHLHTWNCTWNIIADPCHLEMAKNERSYRGRGGNRMHCFPLLVLIFTSSWLCLDYRQGKGMDAGWPYVLFFQDMASSSLVSWGGRKSSLSCFSLWAGTI